MTENLALHWVSLVLTLIVITIGGTWPIAGANIRQEFSTFYRQYILSGRGILENELMLNVQEKQRLFDMLMENAKDENKYFRYDFFYDNCSTRIRDILVKAFPEIQLPTTQIVRPTFRKTIDLYLTKLGWADFGIDLVLNK